MDETQEEISLQLEELQRLMATLDINEKTKITEESDDENKFVYDFDSESSSSEKEGGPQIGLVKADDPESSEQGSKRKRDQQPKQEMIISDKYNEQKYKNIPAEYKPHINPYKEEGILDIDCSIDVGKDLRDWYHRNVVLIQLDDKLTKLGPKSVFNYLKTKTTGNAWRYLAENPDPALPEENQEVINYVYSELKKEFVGFKDVDAIQDLKDTNLHKIFNLRICDMCQLDNFIWTRSSFTPYNHSYTQIYEFFYNNTKLALFI